LPKRERGEVRQVATEVSALLELEREPELTGVD
jgi:hypothetical protein